MSILCLIFLVTLKAVCLGFHLEFHWFPGVSKLLASLGHTGIRVVLGHTLNTLQHIITKTSHNVLSKFMILCWAAFIAILSCRGHRLDAAGTPTEYFVPEIRFLFVQLIGLLTLAFFFHNCIITALKNSEKQENNVRVLSIACMLVT